MSTQDTYILTLDQGTTSSRAIIFDQYGARVAQSKQEFPQHFPQPSWVEHDTEDIWKSQLATAHQAIKEAGITPEQIAAISITNQRETVVAWDALTGQPLHHAIVWQDRRTSTFCDHLKAQGRELDIKQRTGLVIDPYFSATKMKWLIDNVEAIQSAANKNTLRFGTIDTYLIWKLTQGKSYSTDVSNASRTMLFNIHSLSWDDTLLDLFSIRSNQLPEVVSNDTIIGQTETSLFGQAIPIVAGMGDQQAALFGQGCFNAGMAKNTYGTGCFMLMNTGHQAASSAHGLLSTIAWQLKEQTTYALEGSVFIAGAAVQWLRDGLKLLEHSSDSAYHATQVEDTDGVVVVPAFVGLGAPYWDSHARGAIFGLTRGVQREHLIRATLESIAFQSYDVLTAMSKDAGFQLKELRVDGGASTNDMLMQFQADIINTSVVRQSQVESTAWGAAAMAGIAIGLWDINALRQMNNQVQHFRPTMTNEKRTHKLHFWKRAVERTLRWEE